MVLARFCTAGSKTIAKASYRGNPYYYSLQGGVANFIYRMAAIIVISVNWFKYNVMIYSKKVCKTKTEILIVTLPLNSIQPFPDYCYELAIFKG